MADDHGAFVWPTVRAARCRGRRGALGGARAADARAARRPSAAECSRSDSAHPGARSKRTSELSVFSAAGDGDGDEEEQRYELLSFKEDPRLNHACCFRDEDGRGFAAHRVGSVHQKLMVQRLLDSAEKHRVKDRQERSVRESKARASKLLDAPEPKAPKRPRLALPTRTRAATKAVDVEPVAAQARLPSALTAEEAKEMRARIEAGVERAEEELAVAGDDLFSEVTGESAQEDAGSATDASVNDPPPAMVPTETTTKEPTAPAKPPRKRATKAAASSATTPRARTKSSTANAAADIDQQGDKSPRKRARKETAPLQGLDKFLSEVKPPADESKLVESAVIAAEMASAESGETAPQGAADAQSNRTKDAVDRAVATVKRPRQRSVPMPDLSFFPSAVAEICERVAKHKSRSAVLDEQDYDAFVEQYEGFQRDWETLDKAYSIEFVLSEGLQLQLEMAEAEELRSSLNDKLAASRRKAEGLQFVQTTMGVIQKLLGGIQASVARFDRKTT